MATTTVLPMATPVSAATTRHAPASKAPVTRALLSKNWIVKKRHPFATISEVLNPLLCILLFAFLKTLDADLDIPAGWATTTANKTIGTSNTTGSHWNLFAKTDLLSDFNSTIASAGLAGGTTNVSTPSQLLNSTVQLLTSGASPLSLVSLVSQLRVPRFYFTETTMPGLIMNLALQALSEAPHLNELRQRDLLLCIAKFALLGYTSLEPTSLYYLPTECQGKLVPYKLAIAPDTLYTRKYMASILDAWYPRLPLIEPILGISPLTTPSFADSRVFFDNESALEAYLAGDDYGLDVDHPKIYAAITFQEFPNEPTTIGDLRGHDITFALRMNSTFTDTNFPNSVPRTISRRFNMNKYLRSVKSQNTMIYATRGFLTLQTAVMRVLNCLPPWDVSNERVQDPDRCQLTQSTLNDTSDEVNNRLLKQLEDDLIIGTLLRVLSGMSDFAEEAFVDPSLIPRIGNNSAAIAKVIKTLSSPELTVANMPDRTKRSLLRVLRQAPQPFHGSSVFMSPTEAFHYAGFYDKVRVVFPVLFILSYLYGVSRVIVALLMEKETRSREFMKILGVLDHEIVLTWLITYLQLFFLASLLQTIGASVLLFNHSNGLLLFVFFFTFALSSFGFGFLISTLFNRARAGSFVGMGLFFMMFFVSFSFKESTSEAPRTLSCLLSPVALSQGVNIIAQLESIGVGLNFANADDNIGGFRFISAVYMQLLDFFLYMAAGWYLEKVMPKEYGVSERWYIPFSPAYWRRSRRIRHRLIHEASPDTTSLAILDLDANRIEEQVPIELKQQEQDDRAIVISKLRKVFDVPGGTKVAVHGLNLSLYEGQITCLLGHNGAGKTTLMSMLTGMTPPTSGNARIRGVSILDGMDMIRKSLGYCPQFSVVYPELTVEEHLRFYARVKQDHTNPHGGADSIDRMIREVGLTEKRFVQAHALSGGMKRKLSLAISFLGNNSVVFLDEPTSGMDPYSRRSTWELIQRHKTGRIVILTTHFMDEADLLGDRIAIMAEGELRCVGSSLFLKQRYGVGYRLSFVVKTNSRNEKKTGHDERQFVELVQGHVAEARLATDIGTEFTFQLPFETSAKFPALFDAIDQHKHELGITSYAISVTTLEEIFLKVAESTPQPSDDGSSTVVPAASAIDQKLETIAADDHNAVRESHNRVMWFVIQVRALLLKRLLSAKRDRGMLFYSTLLPIVILFAGLSALRLSLFIKNDPSLELTTVDQYDLGTKTPLPVACVHVGGGTPVNSDTWCESTFQFFPDAIPSRIDVESIVYDGTVSPRVFNLSYVAPTIQPNDTTGYCLRYAQLVFERGYGKDSESMTPLSTQSPVLGQYGGLLFQATASDRVLSYNVLVNSTSVHGAPTYKALADQAIHNFILANGSTSTPFKRIRVATHPFPLSFKTRSIFGSFLSLPAVIFVLIAFTFIPAAMMPFLVKEKQHESNACHQQLLSGVSLPAYWLANLLFDLLLYIVPMIVAIMLMRFYNISSSLSGSNADSKTCTACTRDVPQAVVALFALFGTAIAPWTYAMSHLMNDAGACLLYTVMLNFLFGLVLLLTSYSLDSLDSTRAANQVLVYLWRCSPLFSLSNGLLRVIISDIEALFGFNSEPLSAFSKDIAGYEIAYLAVQGPVFFLLALLVDMIKTGELTVCGRDVRVFTECWRKWMSRRSYRALCGRDQRPGARDAAAMETLLVDDEDVRAERDRVLKAVTGESANQREEDDVVQITQLSKTYGNGKKAVSNLTFGLRRGDCFGFLGINGAGKTTTMKILTGDLFPTRGSATLNGYDILRERARVRQSVGYCPQFDALLELLTVREHLELYGRLKGFSGKHLALAVRRLLTQFQLHPFERKLAGSLSGGNKRKLSVAIAMLGEPALLFLDEPSTGMDPYSRRFMWDIILQVSVQSRKSTIVLTTHSMEECEALCNRAGIMVGGRLQCFGTIPHLKSRFGDGFLLECKLETASLEAIEAFGKDLEQRGLIHQQEDERSILSTQLDEVCETLGAPERVFWILPDSSGTLPSHPTGLTLYEQIQRSAATGNAKGSLDVDVFSAWWLLEDRVVRLATYLQAHFSMHGSVVMVERQLDYCRFKLTPAIITTTATESYRPFALARMFRLIEDGRRELGIKEYSIAQTSLEQIFNSFARQQDEEKDVAHGFVH